MIEVVSFAMKIRIDWFKCGRNALIWSSNISRVLAASQFVFYEMEPTTQGKSEKTQMILGLEIGCWLKQVSTQAISFG